LSWPRACFTRRAAASLLILDDWSGVVGRATSSIAAKAATTTFCSCLPMSVQPPTGAGHVRLVRIGDGDEQVDLQPCGGTHVARTSEIGRIRLGKVENKGRGNRRVNLHLDG